MKYVFDSSEIEYLEKLVYYYGDYMFDVCSDGSYDENSMDQAIKTRHVIFKFLLDHMEV